MNNKAYLQLLMLPIVVMSPALSASDNPDLPCLIDSASRSVRSRQFDQAINDLIPALRVAKRERASNETVSAILSNLGYSYRMVGRCGDAVTVLKEEMRAWDRGMVAVDQARLSGINLLQSYFDCGDSRSAARSWSKTLKPIARKLNPDSPALCAGPGSARGGRPWQEVALGAPRRSYRCAARCRGSRRSPRPVPPRAPG
jgi:hypothetical protein